MADERPQPMIVMTPPAQPATAHPRRPPAHRSVSLLHSPRKRPASVKDQKSDSSSDSAAANRPTSNSGSPSSLLPLGRDSSGESSNAEKWFEKSNNEVRDNSASFADNDPPFFMRNSSSSETPPDAQQQQARLRQLLGGNSDGPNSLPMRTGLMQLGTDGSSTEDFRSVIDDLTIENKKLKQRLKKYEKLHDSHLRDEKLFEVRIHGLPPEKKRELEDTLRKFASGLASGFPTNGYEGLLPVLNKQNTIASSQMSFQNADSAYASMSASGQGSAQSGGETRYTQSGPNATSRKQNMHSNIHSYLHHIPEGLMPPTNPATMTERAKKKLVVRRLEQIFAGKGATLGGHQHSLQQQDVSQMAARADRVASEAQGQRARKEGNRESHIMRRPVEDKQDGDNTSPDELDEQKHPSTLLESKTVHRTPSHASNEQRPTRPLDLDPHRAQIPEDNLNYIRHLGFSPPDLETRVAHEDGHGWIYLNLLINMAQLHTINVTDNFVRKALTEYSSKFELSHDGRKVRWKGGRSVTRTSSSGGGSSIRTEMNTPDHSSPRKRPKLSHRESGKSGVLGAQPGAVSGLRSQHENNKLVYTPLFFHKDSTDEAEDSSEEEDDSMSSPFPAPVAGNSTAMTSSGIRTAASTKKIKKRDDGPIIFYNNARFCTDLSGDRKATGNSNAPPYVTATQEPLGKPQKKNVDVPSEKRGPLATTSQLPEPMDLGDNPIPASMEIAFPPQSPLHSDNYKRTLKPIEMEVTGIGGVWPSDNFAIAVESRHARFDHKAEPVSHDVPSQRIPPRFASILQESGRKTRAAVHKQILTTETKVLPPSNLPPALSYMPFSEDSLDDDDSEMGDDMSVSPESPGALPPSAAPQPVELHYTSSDEYEDDDDDDDESDSSLDLLAAARELDPEAIRAREREYDANMAERLAEEIPAGSSAATAGGGSGYASPNFSSTGMGREEYEKAVKAARARPSVNRRSGTADSMKVQNPHESSSESEGDEMDDVAS